MPCVRINDLLDVIILGRHVSREVLRDTRRSGARAEVQYSTGGIFHFDNDNGTTWYTTGGVQKDGDGVCLCLGLLVCVRLCVYVCACVTVCDASMSMCADDCVEMC